MDNLTHSLVGAALAECAWSTCPEADPVATAPGAEARAAAGEARRRTLWWTSILASNAPDLDVLWSFALGGKLGYLLHHRGHTHTLVTVPLQALLVLATMWALRRLLPRLGGPLGPGDRARVVALAALGPALHQAMDHWNLYGVHPLWPWDSRWFYGDQLFVLEPWVWCVLMPALLAAWPQARALRVGLPVALVAVWTLGLTTGLLAAWQVVAMAVAFLTTWFVLRGRPRLAAPVGLAVVALGVVDLGGVRDRLKAEVRASAADARLHDVILAPFPGDPSCWALHTVEVDEARDLYRLRRGAVARPELGAEAALCLARFEDRTTAPLRPSGVPATERLAFGGEFVASLSQLRTLAHERCRFAAFLQFARAPFWAPRPGGAMVFGDLRFDRGESLGFSEFVDTLGPEDDCADLVVPGWTPPVAGLLVPAGLQKTSATSPK